jgi:hypothetical protein
MCLVGKHGLVLAVPVSSGVLVERKLLKLEGVIRLFVDVQYGDRRIARQCSMFHSSNVMGS